MQTKLFFLLLLLINLTFSQESIELVIVLTTSPSMKEKYRIPFDGNQEEDFN